jgi:hypothetical protein
MKLLCNFNKKERNNNEKFVKKKKYFGGICSKAHFAIVTAGY